MASQPVFDLHVPGRPNSSAMDYFAERGFDTWSIDMEGYGRSTKDRGIDATIAEGADDLKAGTDYIFKTRNHTGPLLVYGISSGALRAALFAQRYPEPRAAARARRPCLDRRRQPDAGGAAQEAAGLPQDQAAADQQARSSARSSSATIPAPPTTT